jgi:hypothetical protein
MRLSRFTGAQITGVTKEKEAGLATVEVCRKHRLARQPEAAHGHGKPDNAILKDLLGKKAEDPRPKVRHGAWCDVGLPGLEATSLRADWRRVRARQLNHPSLARKLFASLARDDLRGHPEGPSRNRIGSLTI